MLKRFIIAALSLVIVSGVLWAADIGSLSTTDSSNTARFPESMPLSDVNNGARALEGIIARYARDTLDGCPTASGTNTITVSANRSISAYYDGLTQCWVVGTTNTGNVTLNVDSVGAYKVVTPNNVQVSSGNLQANARVLTQWSEPLSAWQLIASPATPYNDPLTTNGDIPYYSGGTTRLAIGSSGQVLTNNGTSPLWIAFQSLLDGIWSGSSSTRGDVLFRGATSWQTLAAGASGQTLTTGGSGANPSWNNAGVLVAVAATHTGGLLSGSTAVPADDSIPQNTEGDQYMTLSITPNSSSDVLDFTIVVQGAVSTATVGVCSLFQDSTAGALAAAAFYIEGADRIRPIILQYSMTAGTTSSTTFKVRCGGGSGTFYFNGTSSGRQYGGVLSSSMIIRERTP